MNQYDELKRRLRRVAGKCGIISGITLEEVIAEVDALAPKSVVGPPTSKPCTLACIANAGGMCISTDYDTCRRRLKPAVEQGKEDLPGRTRWLLEMMGDTREELVMTVKRVEKLEQAAERHENLIANTRSAVKELQEPAGQTEINNDLFDRVTALELKLEQAAGGDALIDVVRALHFELRRALRFHDATCTAVTEETLAAYEAKVK